nr:electron transport complex subunit E [Maliibacterium massiliense]
MARKAKENKLSFVFLNGILGENPTFRLLLGMCPTLATTTSVQNGFAMGLAATFVLVGSNLVVSLLKNFIPEKVRIPSYVVIIASFVTVVQLLMEAFVPALYAALGIFIPLIVVNCIILARAESFASKNGPVSSVFDGLGIGIGFTLALTLISSVREILGSGTWFGLRVMPAAYTDIAILRMPPGGFITLGILIALINIVVRRIQKGRAAKKGETA